MKGDSFVIVSYDKIGNNESVSMRRVAEYLVIINSKCR